jgi:hypothetical protein
LLPNAMKRCLWEDIPAGPAHIVFPDSPSKKSNTSLSLMRQACRVFLAKRIYHQRGEVT